MAWSEPTLHIREDYSPSHYQNFASVKRRKKKKEKKVMSKVGKPHLGIFLGMFFQVFWYVFCLFQLIFLWEINGFYIKAYKMVCILSHKHSPIIRQTDLDALTRSTPPASHSNSNTSDGHSAGSQRESILWKAAWRGKRKLLFLRMTANISSSTEIPRALMTWKR